MATVGAVPPGPHPLPIEAVDLESLVVARNDTHPDGDWWFDPRSGQVLYLGLDDDTDLADLARGVHVLVPSDPQPAADIDEFLADAPDEAEAARLYEAFHAKGGLKRFRRLIGRSPLADAWTDFTVRRESVRAIDWLLDRGLVEPASAATLRAELTS